MQKQEQKPQTGAEILTSIKNLLEDFRDEGEYRYYADIASTTPTDIDFIRDFGFAIKGYFFDNDGQNAIQVGHMSASNLLDVAPERFTDVLPADDMLKIKNNVKCIRRIILKTAAGVSAYRLRVFW
jgi:hypothetical protein